MASPETCFVIASDRPGWVDMEPARKAAEAIEVELGDRRGLGLDGVDDEVREEIMEAWAEIIRQAMTEGTP